MQIKGNQIFVIGLLFIAIAGMSACADSKKSDTHREVLADAYELVEQKAIPDRWEQLNDLGWGAALLTFGEVEQSDSEPGVYSIGFPPDPYYPENDYEIWELSYDPDVLIPVNGAAYLTGSLLFCDSLEDQSPECQIYASGVKNMIDQVRTE